MNPLVSVIIPVYNGKYYIERCLSMLEKQTFTDFEVIMIDDGSTDGTPDAFDLLNNDARFRMYVKENGGVSTARNYGVSLSSGKYIIFIDVDDYVYEWHIEELYRNLLKYSADVSVCGYYKLGVGEKKPKIKENSEIRLFSGVDAAKAMLYRKGLNGYPCLKLIAAPIAKEISFKTGVAYGEDAMYVFDLYCNCKRVVYSPHISYLYYQNMGSALHSINCEKMERSWNAAVEMLDEVKQNSGLLLAYKNKLFMQATDYACRLKELNYTDDFFDGLLNYIKMFSSDVMADKESKIITRLLAVFAHFNPKLVVNACCTGLNIRKKLGIVSRKSM